MEDENSSYLGFGIFFFLVVLMVAVGSILIYINKTKSNHSEADEVEIVDSEKIKLDKEKDFVYYTLEEKVSDNLDFVYKKANINIKGSDAQKVNEELDKLYEEALKSVKKSNDSNICENESDIYSANVIDYILYKEEYISLLVEENSYTCTEDIQEPNHVYAYVFDARNGDLISSNELLEKYNLTYTQVLEKLEQHLKAQYENNTDIQINKTLNELKENENYILYISDNKKLVMKYIVKTTSVDYNDVIELN